MAVYRFRCPGQALSAGELLERVLPETSAEERQSLLRARALRCERRGESGFEPGPAAGARVAAGTALWLEGPASSPPTPFPSGAALRALLPGWPWSAGRGGGEGEGCSFALQSEREGVVELALRWSRDQIGPLLRWLASAGTPVLGDVEHGGIALSGGLRLASEEERGPHFWPEEPIFAPGAEAEGAGAGELAISRASARALARGHPWILFDPQTGDTGRFAAGALVRAVSRGGDVAGLVRVDGEGSVAARSWAPGAARPRRALSVEARVAHALQRRAALVGRAESEGSDAYRLVHGEADGLPGLAVDRLGSVLRVLVTARSALPLRERVVAALLGQLGQEFGGEASVVEVLHLPRRPAGELTCARLVGGPVPPAPLVVTEAGLQFRVEPGLTESSRPRPGTGLFLDQRENRTRLRARVVAGGRYLNLFAHTGAFSAALLAGGAEQVVSVDLSAPYLAWLEENLERSELPRDRHVSVRADARRFLAEASDRPFDGIVLDPPTAAAAGRNFFSVRAELVELLAACLERLAPGGWLFVSRNDRRGRGQLAERMEEAAERGGAGLSFLEPAPPGADFPSLRGFPEGDPFEAVITGRA